MRDDRNPSPETIAKALRQIDAEERALEDWIIARVLAHPGGQWGGVNVNLRSSRYQGASVTLVFRTQFDELGQSHATRRSALLSAAATIALEAALPDVTAPSDARRVLPELMPLRYAQRSHDTTSALVALAADTPIGNLAALAVLTKVSHQRNDRDTRSYITLEWAVSVLTDHQVAEWGEQGNTRECAASCDWILNMQYLLPPAGTPTPRLPRLHRRELIKRDRTSYHPQHEPAWSPPITVAWPELPPELHALAERGPA